VTLTQPRFNPPTRAAWVALFVASVLLAACETTPQVMPVEDPQRMWDQRLVQLAAVDRWAAVGKLGIQSAGDSWTAGLSWRQGRDSYTIRLSGPLGQGLMELRGSAQAVELTTSNGDVFQAPTAGELMQTHAGWQVPLSGLRHWILGRPDPQARIADLQLDPGGRLAELRQLGWHIRYQRYAEFDGLALPTKLTLENPRLRAKLALRRWHTGPDST
jgi:outer membrane lipoprotein LolB